MMELLQKGETHRASKEVYSGDNRNDSNHSHQVCFINLEPGHSNRNVKNSVGNIFIANRDSLLKQVEMPIFEGIDTYGWIVKVERFFRIGGNNEEEKLELVSVSLAGDVASWFNSDIRTIPYLDWRDFKERLLAKFIREKIRDPS